MFYNVKSDQLEHQKQFLILMVRVLAFFQSLGSVSSGQWSWVVVRRVLRVFWNTTGEGQHQKPSGVTAIITFLILVWPCSTLVCLILAIFNKFLQQYSLKKWHLQSTEYTSRIVRITQTLFFFFKKISPEKSGPATSTNLEKTKQFFFSNTALEPYKHITMKPRKLSFLSWS